MARHEGSGFRLDDIGAFTAGHILGVAGMEDESSGYRLATVQSLDIWELGHGIVMSHDLVSGCFWWVPIMPGQVPILCTALPFFVSSSSLSVSRFLDYFLCSNLGQRLQTVTPAQPGTWWSVSLICQWKSM